MKIYAAGTPAGGTYPTMKLLIDDKLAATYDSVKGNVGAREFVELTYAYTGALTGERVRLEFVNDAMINGQDRNLYVDKITLDGSTIQTESADTYSTGTWAADTGCNPGNKKSEELACGGYFRYGSQQALNQKPTANISTPAAEANYNAGNIINFSGFGSDAEDGALGAAALSWKIVFHHDTHSHPFLDFAGTGNGSFTIPDTGETAADTWYRIILTATDSNGQTSTASRDIFPHVIKMTLLR